MQATAKFHVIVFTLMMLVMVDVSYIHHTLNRKAPKATKETAPEATTPAPAAAYHELEHSVDTEPQFPGGWDNWKTYMAENLRIPDARMQQAKNVGISFVVGADGAIQDVKLRTRIPDTYKAAALKLMAQSPAWEPATKNNQPVAAEYFVTVSFLI